MNDCRDVTGVACPLCGCLCDDIVLTTDGQSIVDTRRACPPARTWYLQQSSHTAHPAATIDGQAASLEAGLHAAQSILCEAKYPLIYGLGRVSCEAQREAVRLAEALGAALDTHTSLAHGSTKLASQLVGKVTCTLGEIRNRADLVVYWGTNPLVTHPRHATRYSVFPPGRYLSKQGGRARQVVLVDVRSTPTRRLADQFLQIQPGADFDLVTALRALVRGQRIDWQSLAATGLARAEVEELLQRIRAARFGIFFFGDGLTRSRGTHMNVAALLALTRELNDGRRFTAMPMRNLGNEAGADNVLSWLAGYPFSIDYSRGHPRYNPGEFSVVPLLERGDNDAALVVGADPADSLPPACVEHLARIPTVLLDPRVTATSRIARVQIFTSVTGVHESGTAYRMDKVPVPLRAALASTAPSDAAILAQLADGVER